MKVFRFLFLMLLLSPLVSHAQDVYEVKFTVNITQYRAALILYTDGTGKMRVRYFSDGATHMVEQYIRKESTTAGLRLTGYNPVYPGTSIKFSNYSADNLYVSQDENGNISCTNIDDTRHTADCFIRIIKGYYLQNEFLKDFNWKL